jgi:hypothetical protein
VFDLENSSRKTKKDMEGQPNWRWELS